MSLNELVFDTWTTLTFKQQFGPRRVPGQSWTAPTWVGEDHRRRLLAYMVLQAYIDNAAREFLPGKTTAEKAEHREYGDPSLFRNAALSAVLGEGQAITVDGAADDPEADGADAEQIQLARRQQAWLEGWADAERFPEKMQECESNAVGLGDGVYTLGWSSSKQRPRLRVFDPGFYFPVLDDGNEDDYPERVHIAWEVPSDDGKVRVRRLTWELEDLEEPRAVPYQDEPATKTCLFTDATWTLADGVVSVDDLTRSTAEYQQNEDGEDVDGLDLGIDFIPVVHITNTVAGGQHYGRSTLAYIAQLFDDISAVDTDLEAAAATTGTPPIALSGVTTSEDTLTVGPGVVYKLGENGRMTALDTSKSLDALLKLSDSLLERLSVNGRMPAALLGRVDPSEVPSGVAMTLSFGPHSAMVREMRLARRAKYRLLFRFVHRMALVGGQGGDDGLPNRHITTDLELGAFLPNDEAGVAQNVIRLLEAGAISLEAAVEMLRAVGLVDRDQQDEIAAIQSRDFEGASTLFDATGDLDAVFDYLGRERPQLPEAPPIPPGGPQPPPPLPPGP
jgi:hypothetical protein